MKMVIEIDKKAFDYIMACSFVEDEAVTLNQSLEDRIKTLMFFDVLNAIKSGTPLPKGHGRLIDGDEIASKIDGLKDNWNRYRNEYESGRYESYDYAVDEIVDAPTIIETDKEE